jgi:hypothetical protein
MLLVMSDRRRRFPRLRSEFSEAEAEEQASGDGGVPTRFRVLMSMLSRLLMADNIEFSDSKTSLCTVPIASEASSISLSSLTDFGEDGDDKIGSCCTDTNVTPEIVTPPYTDFY